MAERISRKTDYKIYQPKLLAQRVRELHAVKEITKRPMTILLDEAVSFYLATYCTTPEYKLLQAKQEAEMRAEDQDIANEFPNDDVEDLSNHVDPYG